MKTALYFGSFNPVHNGHLGIAKYLIDNYLCDEVCFVVSPCNPLKERKDELIDENVRLQMLKLAIAAEPRFSVSDIEFRLPKPSYTIDTLRVLSAEYPQTVFSLVIGADNAADFAKWKNYSEIISDYQIFVYPREGYIFDNQQFPQMELLNTELYDVSSTKIRHSLRKNPELLRWLNPDVADFILKNGLYE
ncbi:MAG: nicotinate-nucleotide adenylyltransferase [Paludibacter sp.]|jgi:nicotinate-nucleotide adenylyltransferase|nr:nicotinate-nucleotide adenylyltransferase [Paludibacter sp.]